jgi:TolB protein
MSDPKMLFSRRQMGGLFTGLAGASLLPASAFAQSKYLDIRRGSNFQPVPIAVTNFAGDQGPALSGIITNNFARSVFLQPLEPRSFPEQISNPDAPPRADAWRMINAQFVVTGRVARAPDGRMQTQFRLWDVSTGQQVSGQQYVTDPNNARRVAHIVSDAIFSRITGEKGFFDSRVVFIDESGPKERRAKRLAIMDQDGANVRYLTGGGGAKRISYSDGARYSTPVWSPKGDFIAFTRQKGGSFSIGVMKPDGSGERIITEGYHNEGPTWAPNGLYVMFFRDPGGGGGPKIYMADVFGRGEFAVPTQSFGSDPAWGPLLS